MKKLIISITLCILAGFVFASAPEVTNVLVTPEVGRVVINYDLACETPCNISLFISDNDGVSYDIVPHAVSGDIGSMITAGEDKEIIWRPGADGMVVGELYRARVVAVNDNFTFVLVPGGTFTMGATREYGQPDERPTHSVTLNPFYIGKYTVTQREFQAIMGFNPAQSFGIGNNYPAHSVSWYHAIKYCNLRSMAEGLTPVYSINGSTNPADWGEMPANTYDAIWDLAICYWNANGYRLLTEAEWEYAARGASNVPDYLYSGSNGIDGLFPEDVAWYSNSMPQGTKPVGTKLPNRLGIYDMSGNVWEWCWDLYSSSYYSSSPESNPTGPERSIYVKARVKRGGYWHTTWYECRVSKRNYDDPGRASTQGHTGFRIGRSGPVPYPE